MKYFLDTHYTYSYSLTHFHKFTGTSLRIAMFKRQKSLETQQFLGSFSTSYGSADTLNLQITGKPFILNINKNENMIQFKI